MLFVVAAVLFAVFVWPTRYKDVGRMHDEDGVAHPLRLDRITHQTEVLSAEGQWVEYKVPRPDYDSRDTPTGAAVGKAQQAGDDIRKMNDVTQDVIKNGVPGR